MATLFQEDGPVTGDQVREEVIALDRQWQQLQSELEEFETRFERSKPDSDSPNLQSPTSKFERMRMFPVAMWIGHIVPLWSRRQWSAEELDLARAVTDALQPYGAPEVAFVAGGSNENRAALSGLSVWFRDLVSDDSVLASLIYTLDDGPYVGLPDPGGPSDILGDVQLAPNLLIELALLSDPSEHGAFLFRALRDDGQELWARLVSKDPTWSIEDIEFSETAPADLGPYGWKVNFVADGEYGHLYVARDGRLRFYFISW